MCKIICVDENTNMTKWLDIELRLIIPTLNRPKQLLHNVKKIISDFSRINSSISIEILISDNLSAPDKRIKLSDLESVFTNHNYLNNLSLIFIKRTSRLPLGSHMRWLGNLPGAEWVMWLGDDDVLSPTYFKFVFDNLGDESLMAFAPGYGPIDAKDFFEICNKKEIFEKPGRSDGWHDRYQSGHSGADDARRIFYGRFARSLSGCHGAAGS